MRRFWHLATARVHIPLVEKADDAYKKFSPSGRALFLLFATLLVVSAMWLLVILNDRIRVATPGYGSTFVEGIIGSPRFINPVLAVTDTDHDLTTLVYSGLVKTTASGTYVPDLAEQYEISPEGTVYTFVLREGLTFHDGTPVTAEDVAFTVERVQDAAIKSAERANWLGVGVEVVDSRTIRFTLESPYAPFIKNATLGILPAYLWSGVSAEEFPFSDLNTSPIGSGPFKISTITRNPSGIPITYVLEPFAEYALGKPFIAEIVVHFYQNEEDLVEAFIKEEIEAASGISPAALENLSQETIMRSSLNRVFGVFFNQNESVVLRELAVRKALNEAIDRDALVQEVLGGYGTPLRGPVPPGIFSEELEELPTPVVGDRALAAREMLVDAGWKLNESGILTKTTGSGAKAETTTLAFSLSTGNVPELRAAAEFVKREWERMGASVEIKLFDQGDLSQNVIRPRKYDALLFGEVVGRELDLFAFWESSQRNDPGLNIALYANATADRALKDLRETTVPAERKRLYQEFLAEIEADIPAVFLYAPDFVYSVPNDIHGLSLGFVESPSDRFLSAAAWYRETDYVWPIFVR